MNDKKYEVRAGKFSLNLSTIKREDNGKQYPDWFGETIIKVDPDWKAGDVIKYKISGWTSQSQAGNKYISCTMQEKVETTDPEKKEVKDQNFPF